MMKQLLILLALCACFISLSHQRQYSPGRFIVKLDTNDEATANGIAQELGMTNYGKLGELPNVYIFQRPTLKTKASRRLVRDVTAMQSLNSHNLVQWAEQDHVFEGVLKALPSDPSFANQWNYNNNDYPASAINVESVWNNSNTGQGIVVQVVDDGLWANNTDIAPNYLSEYSYNFATGANDPTPTSLSTYHGTFCGALIAGKENNGYCGVGVAYSAKLAGIRAIGVSNTTTSGMANYLTKFPTQVHISSNSWGPEGCVAEGCDLYPLGNAILEALQAGVQTGRNNSGRIYVFAAGNEGDYGGNTNYQEHTTNRFVIPVGAIEKNGTRAYYSNVGASLLVVAPGGGLQGGVVSTAAATCSSNMGTSFATPQVSGVVALMLRENSQLGWRDVKSILLKTAYQVDANSTSWSTNAAGYKFSNEYGFGRVDAALAVATAKTWKNLGAELSLSGTSTTAVSIPDATLSGASSSITIAQTSSTSVTSVEHVQVVVKITHANRGQLAISLISPSGTESVLTNPRTDNNADYDSWQMLTVKSWGERANGTWTLKVVDSVAGTTGTLNAWAITVFGTGTSTSAAASIFADFFIQVVVMVVFFAFML